MALSFSVFNRFKAIDGVTAPIRKMGKNVGRFGKTTVAAFRKSDRAASRFSKTLRTILVVGGILAGLAVLRAGVGDVTRQFIQFDDAIIAAGARFKDIGPDVDDFTARIQGIKTAAREAGAVTEFTAAESAQALDFLARAGFTSVEAIGSLTSMINLATASGEEFNEVADMSSDLLGAFSLASDNSAQKIKNLSRLNDVLVKAVNSANVTVTDMFETMKQVGPIAAGVLGASLEEVSALTMVMGSSGIKGTAAMTALKNAYLRLAAPASKARKVLDAMDVSMKNSTGGARKMTDLMEEIGEKISGLGKVEQAEILDILFGKRAIAGGKNMIDNIRNIKNFEKSLAGASGTAQKTADLIRKSLGNRLKTLNSSLMEFGFRILENFEIKGKKGLDTFTEAIRGIDVKPLVGVITILVAIFVSLYKILSSVARFVNEVVIASIIDFYEIFGPLIAVVGIVIGVFVGVKLAIMAISAAAVILTAIMAINPFTIFLIAAASVVLAIRTIIKNWDFLKNEITSGILFVTDKLKALTGGVIGKIAGFLGFGAPEQPEQPEAPISPNAGLVGAIRQETETRSRVSVDFSNLPKGAEVKQTGKTPGFDLELGFAGA